MSKLAKVAEKYFIESTVDRSMEIIHDDGLYRHLKYYKAGTRCMGVHITTWPGYLAISGDMGCYVFARINDMFEFFRGDDINESYWAEKVQASDKCDGLREFDEDTAREWVADTLRQAKEDGATDLDDIEDEAEMINYDDGIIRFHDSLPAHRIFRDAWDNNFERYTFRYLWCCYAIVWAIKEYDHSKCLTTTAPGDGK